MSTSLSDSSGNTVMHLKITYPRRRPQLQQQQDLRVHVRLVVCTYQEFNAISPRRIVEDRLVESAHSGRLDDRVHAMFTSAMRGCHGVSPHDVLFLSRNMAAFARSSLYRMSLQQQRKYSCMMEVQVNVHEWMTRELEIAQQILPFGSDLSSGFGGVPASEEAIEAVQATTYASPPAEDGRGMIIRETACAVCLEDFVSGQELRVMPCGHAFHKGCLDPWLKTSHVCPLCRFQIATQEAAAQQQHQQQHP